MGDGPAVDGGATASPLPAGDGGGLFTENIGQWHDQVRFVAQGPFGEAVFGDEGVAHVLRGVGAGHCVRVSFDAPRAVEPRGLVDTARTSNYILGSDPGSWVTGARSFGQLVYEDVWPGIDVRYRFSGGHLKYDVMVGADADPADVRFVIEGDEGLTVDRDALTIDLSDGLSIQDRDLVARYEGGESVDVRFARRGNGYGFDVEKAAGRALVIDPLVVAGSTFVGGTYDDICADAKMGPEGDVYVVGTTTSMDYPVTAGAFMEEYVDRDVVVTKLSRDCSQVLWSTYIGGGGEDLVTGLELDDGGDIFLMGSTKSTDFPVTEGSLQSAPYVQYTPDLYVLRLGSGGDQLVYSTYVGGYFEEFPGDIDVQDGVAYVVGTTDSSDFPLGVPNCTVPAKSALLFALDADGRMLWTRTWGNGSSAKATCVQVAPDGDVVVGGYTFRNDFPTTPGAYKTSSLGYYVGFVLRYRPSTDELLFCTLLGETYVRLDRLALDDEGNVYVAGWTLNVTAMVNFPCTPGAFDSVRNGRADAFLAKFNHDGSDLMYATLLGSEGEETVTDLEVDRQGQLIVAGHFWDGRHYPITPECLDPEWSDGEGFLFVLTHDGTAAAYSTYVGGMLADTLNAVELTDRDTLLIAGTTYSGDLEVTEGAFQDCIAGNRDIFVSEICVLYPPGAPRNLTATGGDGSITLEWEPPLDDGGYPIEDYLVLRGPSRLSMSVLTVLGNETSLVDDDVEYGWSYYYAVRAFNGRGLGPMSNVASARSVTLPDAPTNLTGTVLLSHIQLKWEPPVFAGGSPITGYRLYRGTSKETMEPLATVLSFNLEYADTTVEDRTTYIYELTTVNMVGESKDRCTLTLRNTGPPSPPAGLDHTYGDLFIRLTWRGVVEDHGLPVKLYNVYRGTGAGAKERIGTSAATDPWYVDEDIELGTVYTYTVTAENAKGESEPSVGHEARAALRPSPPMDVAAIAQEHVVRITWSPPESDGASPLLRYKVYHVLGEVGPECVGGVSVEGGGDVDLVLLDDVVYDGVPRRYHVTAVNAEGESDPSATVTTRLYQLPDPPRSLELVSGAGRLSLGWTPPRSDGGTPVRFYTVYRRTGTDDGFLELVRLPATALRYADDTTEAGVECAYMVTASNLAGEGPPSNEVAGMSYGLPTPPMSVTAVGGNGSVLLGWEAPSTTGGLPVQGYQVLGISEGAQVQLLVELGPEAREHVLTGLVNGAVYHFALRAYTIVGSSGLSGIVEGRPVGPPSAPQGLVAFWMGDRVYLTWSTPMETGGVPVRGYRLHREDAEPGNWTEVTGLELSYEDLDVARNVTYNYALHAFNDVGPGPAVRLTFTVPPEQEAPVDEATVDLWPWAMAAVAMMAVLGALLVLGRHGRRDGSANEDTSAVDGERLVEGPVGGSDEGPVEAPAGETEEGPDDTSERGDA